MRRCSKRSKSVACLVDFITNQSNISSVKKRNSISQVFNYPSEYPKGFGLTPIPAIMKKSSHFWENDDADNSLIVQFGKDHTEK